MIAVAHVPVKFYRCCFLKEWAPFIGDDFTRCADLPIIDRAWHVERFNAQNSIVLARGDSPARKTEDGGQYLGRHVKNGGGCPRQ
jgi:hypothetical protein